MICFQINNNSDADLKHESQSNSKPATNDDSDTNCNEVETGKEKLLRWINKQMKIEMTDGRVLIGVFLCTDRDGNVILGSCSEYLTEGKNFFKAEFTCNLNHLPICSFCPRYTIYSSLMQFLMKDILINFFEVLKFLT